MKGSAGHQQSRNVLDDDKAKGPCSDRSLVLLDPHSARSHQGLIHRSGPSFTIFGLVVSSCAAARDPAPESQTAPPKTRGGPALFKRERSC
jgi:hypothetical protein